jgi:predicted Rossmann fold nucleotide-binding protein DprA/Smf involved in DNA uptake
MKLAVVGSRYYTNFEFVEEKINEFRKNNNITQLVSGGAKGVDTLAEEYAEKHNIPITVFEAEWDKYGRGAGPIRNKLIVKEADVIMAFPGENPRGTLNTINLARKENKIVFVHPI